ncbi:hypothetical protein V8C37DRAFT_241480 [Trichoderma ceciliae]
MSDTSPPNGNGSGTGHRRSSITQAALSNLFQRGPSTASSGPPFPGANGGADSQRRRLSISTIGLSGTSPSNTASFMRRGSMSTNSDSIDETAIEDEDAMFGGPRTAPTTPFVRHLSFGGNPAMRNLRTGGSPGNGKSPKSPPPASLGRNPGSGPGDQRLPMLSQSHPHQRQLSISAAWPTAGRRSSLHLPPSSHPQASNIQHPRASSDNPPSRADQYGFNWSEQLRSRAESSVTGARPSFSFQGTGSHSPPRAVANHDRSKSISDMPQPPAQASAVKPKQQDRPKPDAFQERILKGDFYMD